jgi:hypothetical protein
MMIDAILHPIAVVRHADNRPQGFWWLVFPPNGSIWPSLLARAQEHA